jgi:hypothetical protein
MAAGSTTGKVAIPADTPTQIAGPGADIETSFRTSNVKLAFIPDTTPAIIQVGSEAAVTADEGFVFFADSETGVVENFDLVAAEELWLVATEAGELRFFRS